MFFYFSGLFNTGKPVFDPEIHTELIIKDECEDIKTGRLKSYKLTLPFLFVISINDESIHKDFHCFE